MFKKTVDGVLASFHRTIEDLRKISEAKREEAEERNADARSHLALAAAATSEANRADNVADRVEKLIS